MLERVMRVKQTHEAKLMSVEGVEGVGIGSMEDGSLCLLLFVLPGGSPQQMALPSRLEEVPIRMVEISSVVPLEAQQGGVLGHSSPQAAGEEDDDRGAEV